MKVVFFNVKKPLDKLVKLVKCAKLHFEKKKALVFLVSDKKSEQFLDHLLWKNAAFLPHTVPEGPTKELIIISPQKEPLNNAKHIFNLTAETLDPKEFQVIYEFDDGSNWQKKALSKKKFAFYHNLKAQIEAK